MINGWTIVRAFQRNCPRVSMSKDDKNELARLVMIAQEDAARAAIAAVEAWKEGR